MRAAVPEGDRTGTQPEALKSRLDEPDSTHSTKLPASNLAQLVTVCCGQRKSVRLEILTDP